MKNEWPELASDQLALVGVTVDPANKDGLIEALSKALDAEMTKRRIAEESFFYAADIHAANIELAGKSSVGKSQKHRLVGVATLMHNMLQKVKAAPPVYRNQRREDDICQRIENELAYLKDEGKIDQIDENDKIIKPVTDHKL